MLWLAHIGGKSGKHLLELAYFNHYNILDALSGPRTLRDFLGIPILFIPAKNQDVVGTAELLVKAASRSRNVALNILVVTWTYPKNKGFGCAGTRQ